MGRTQRKQRKKENTVNNKCISTYSLPKLLYDIKPKIPIIPRREMIDGVCYNTLHVLNWIDDSYYQQLMMDAGQNRNNYLNIYQVVSEDDIYYVMILLVHKYREYDQTFIMRVPQYIKSILTSDFRIENNFPCFILR